MSVPPVAQLDDVKGDMFSAKVLAGRTVPIVSSNFVTPWRNDNATVRIEERVGSFNGVACSSYQGQIRSVGKTSV